MAVDKDNHINPNLKARWGFAGEEGDITVGPQTVGETGGVDHARTRTAEGGGRNSGGGADPAVETLQLDAIGKLAEGLENGVLLEPESDGPAMRIHQALVGFQEGVQNLSDELAQAKLDLEAERAKNTDPRDSLTIPEIKEQLDAKEVKYTSTANKAELLELLKAQPAP
ncbi:hypothetical protein [Pseudomonas folii]|uniref:HeH/LEM domain-containing protein n=1 Tax=Pseudomonas folii TaxID=2762593 RepID=A0ABR7ATU4_9PSED|nr:hypothetical protein [Pseudomonas folii]MBC3948348.1 hypothetical protein [Pseudomonas folii]